MAGGKRRKGREWVLQGLYAHEMTGNDPPALLEDLGRFGMAGGEDRAFTEALLRSSISRKAEMDQVIADAVQNWDFGRIALIDRLILRMALCELMVFEDIPPKVTINEAIELAKKYSTAESSRFVNGVLDALFRRFKADNKIHKKGRGLLDAPVFRSEPEKSG
ncbi:transcription antitermination factor NusB [bacterium]|nr:transcription antitermination factor NusB [bacterium]